MANVIPNIDPLTIENNGERLFYQAAGQLPKDYTVFYSYKYKSPESGGEPEQIREADFVIVHPALGFLVIEVKQGDILYADGVWQEFKNGRFQPMKRNPVEQARKAMFEILHRYLEQARTPRFPLKAKYGVCFPECSQIQGQPPSDLDPDSILLFRDLENLEDKILALFDTREKRPEWEAIELLIDKILSPTFRVFARLEEHIEMFHQLSQRVLTEEQERLLEETELDKRKIFFGAAGTGKTFLAMEKARRLAAAGKRVFLTCFNKNLARYLIVSVAPGVTALNFHDYLLQVLDQSGSAPQVPEDDVGKANFFDEVLPGLVFDYFAGLPQDRKFDSIIVDEGQDFREDWFACLESMGKEGGEFYIFADPHQNLFNKQIESLQRFPHSKHQLTRNLRNTEPISDWISAFLPAGPLKSQLKGGMRVEHFSWETPAEEKRLIERELGRLVSQGIQPKRVVILSPNVKEKSCLAGSDRIKEWPLVGLGDGHPNGVRFATIRSFKGLEADIVFLIGLKKGSPACTEADIYVGGSRACFLLYVFHEKSLRFPAS